MKQTPRLADEQAGEVNGEMNEFHRMMTWLASIQFNIYSGLTMVTGVNQKLFLF